MSKNDLFLIDVEAVFREKNPKLAKRMPKFVFNFVKRLIHQDEMNQIVIKYQNDKGLDLVRDMVKEFELDVHVYGKENIPNEGKFIFVSNHPLGGLESHALMKEVATVFPKLRFLVNDILLFLKGFEPLFLPVNKHGKNPREYVKIIDDAFSSDAQILIYPSGLVSRKIKGKVVDLEWKKFFITKSVQYQRDVIPVFIDAVNSNKFYNVAKLRKFLRIKANLEMILLPSEVFKQRGKRVDIYFGKPVSCKTFTKDKSQKEWANFVREKVYNLKGKTKR